MHKVLTIKKKNAYGVQENQQKKFFLMAHISTNSTGTCYLTPIQVLNNSRKSATIELISFSVPLFFWTIGGN